MSNTLDLLHPLFPQYNRSIIIETSTLMHIFIGINTFLFLTNLEMFGFVSLFWEILPCGTFEPLQRLTQLHTVLESTHKRITDKEQEMSSWQLVDDVMLEALQDEIEQSQVTCRIRFCLMYLSSTVVKKSVRKY